MRMLQTGEVQFGDEVRDGQDNVEMDFEDDKDDDYEIDIACASPCQIGTRRHVKSFWYSLPTTRVLVNVYCGKETETLEGTSGERVVHKLLSTVKMSEIGVCLDRFFTSVEMVDTLPSMQLG